MSRSSRLCSPRRVEPRASAALVRARARRAQWPRSGRAARADRVTPSARGAVCARRRRKERQRRAAQRSFFARGCSRSAQPPERSATATRNRLGGGAMPAASVPATERSATTKERSAGVRSGRGRPNAPTPRGEPAVPASEGPCGPSAGSEATGAEGRREAERDADPPSAAAEVIAGARWAERRAGALHGGRHDVSDSERGRWRARCPPLRARSVAHRPSARPDRYPPDWSDNGAKGGSRARVRSESAESWRGTCRWGSLRVRIQPSAMCKV